MVDEENTKQILVPKSLQYNGVTEKRHLKFVCSGQLGLQQAQFAVASGKARFIYQRHSLINKMTTLLNFFFGESSQSKNEDGPL